MTFPARPCAEFPNDNPDLHDGAVWTCSWTRARPRAIARASGVARLLSTSCEPPQPEQPSERARDRACERGEAHSPATRWSSNTVEDSLEPGQQGAPLLASPAGGGDMECTDDDRSGGVGQQLALPTLEHASCTQLDFTPTQVLPVLAVAEPPSQLVIEFAEDLTATTPVEALAAAVSVDGAAAALAHETAGVLSLEPQASDLELQASDSDRVGAGDLVESLKSRPAAQEQAERESERAGLVSAPPAKPKETAPAMRVPRPEELGQPFSFSGVWRQRAAGVGAQDASQAPTDMESEQGSAVPVETVAVPLPGATGAREILSEINPESQAREDAHFEEDPFVRELQALLDPCAEPAPDVADLGELEQDLSELAPGHLGSEVIAPPTSDSFAAEELSSYVPGARATRQTLEPLDLRLTPAPAEVEPHCALVTALTSYLLTRGATRAAALIPSLLEGKPVALEPLSQSVQQCLVAEGFAIETNSGIVSSSTFRRRSKALLADFLDGSNHPEGTMDWLADWVRALSAAPDDSCDVRAALVTAGVAELLIRAA